MDGIRIGLPTLYVLKVFETENCSVEFLLTGESGVL